MNYLNTRTPIILFEKAVKSRYYVDKSGMLKTVCENIKSEGQYICITRPRRFGKTVNANMLSAYLTKGGDSRALFDQLDVSKTEGYGRHLNQYHVIHIDLSRQPDGCRSYEEYRKHVTDQLAQDLREAYPKLKEKEYSSVYQMFLDSGDSFIFVLDEWDSVFYRSFMRKEDKDEYLLFLKGLLKDQPYVDLAYMTGVLPIAKYSSGSELDMFDEYNFMNDNMYDRYFGFSEEEVSRLCQKQEKVSFEDIKQWYDGYHLSDGKSLFNPRSVSRALTRGICLNYWTETGPMNEIVDRSREMVDATLACDEKKVAVILEATKRVRVWGVRGSGPMPEAGYLEYGGNTSCISVEWGGSLVVFDAGSGLTALGRECVRQKNIRRIDLFLSHLHLDHVMGLFDFAPLYDPDFELHLYGEGKGGRSLEALLGNLIAPPYWPLELKSLGAKIQIHETGPGQCFCLAGRESSSEAVTMRTFRGLHPDESLLYRLEGAGCSVVYMLDCETTPSVEEQLTEYAREGSLVIWDAGFTTEDLKPGWGHSTWEQGVALRRAAGAGSILMTHYNRYYTDEFIRRQEAMAQAADPFCRFAREGMVIAL